MAVQNSNSRLRSLSYRLSSTPPQQLPAVVPHIAAALLDLRPLLSSASLSKESADSVALHKIKTQISSFLSDHASLERRWTATVLIKTVVDVGGWPILRDSAAWVRGLVGLLAKAADPASTKRLALIALTRIFQSTHQFPTLLREITTPNLPAFVSASLNLVGLDSKTNSKRPVLRQRDRQRLLQTVLECFQHLLPRHPSIFRPFSDQLRTALLLLITPSSDERDALTNSTVESARSLFVLVHITSPKNTGPAEWGRSINNLIADAHVTADKIFRSVVEDWQSTADHINNHSNLASFDAEVQQNGQSALGLPDWSGIYAGSERLVSLLGLMETFIATSTPGPVAFPTGRINDLLLRILLTTVPVAKNTSENQRANDQIAREEREGLWSELPSIHIAALKTAQTLLFRFRATFIPYSQTLTDQICWTCRRESFNREVRMHSYIALTQVLENCGTCFSSVQARRLSAILQICCQDLVPPTVEEPPNAQGSGKSSTATLNADTLLGPAASTTDTAEPISDIKRAASSFLTAYLARVPARSMSSSTRSLADRTAILSNDARAMLASVLNPPHSSSSKAHSSILPFLARAHPALLETEGLLRPRMPVVPTHSGMAQENGQDGHEDDEEPGDVDVDAATDSEEQETDETNQQGKGLGAETMGAATTFDATLETRKRVTPPSSLLGSDVGPKRPRPSSPMPTTTANVAEAVAAAPRVVGAGPASIEHSVSVDQPMHERIDAIVDKTVDGDAEEDEGDDGSDFEMPPLTMEQDTEDEGDGDGD